MNVKKRWLEQRITGESPVSLVMDILPYYALVEPVPEEMDFHPTSEGDLTDNHS